MGNVDAAINHTGSDGWRTRTSILSVDRENEEKQKGDEHRDFYVENLGDGKKSW